MAAHRTWTQLVPDAARVGLLEPGRASVDGGVRSRRNYEHLGRDPDRLAASAHRPDPAHQHGAQEQEYDRARKDHAIADIPARSAIEVIDQRPPEEGADCLRQGYCDVEEAHILGR